MPTCRVCSGEKPAGEFYPRQLRKCGQVGECMECTKARVRDNRARRVEYYRQYDADRFQNDPRVKARHARYKKTDGGKASYRRARQKWLDHNPDKRAAHVLVGNALRSGKIEKASECECCGAKDVRLEGHHEDYSKPLDVVWLCRSCHVARHRVAAE